MRIETKEIEIFTFSEASEELKEKIIESFHLHYDLYDHCMEERIDALVTLSKEIGGHLDYSLSCVPDRGEYIHIRPKYESLFWDRLKTLVLDIDDCPLTGVCYDYDLLSPLVGKQLNTETLHDALYSYIQAIHAEYEAMLKEDYIADLCEANGYEFTSDGRIYINSKYDRLFNLPRG